MSAIEGVFSIRLVIADFYLEKPIFGLDPCYSELRGKEIKKVPIIRIFGANGNGQKTCMHVHGVFPYFYIPFEKKDFESVERGIFQIATHLDKAINISLGQSSSNSQHVFKIHLVKGIPFYGYHRTEHQFLKIYMFNPRFVRRAANLLQNGAILNKNFNPHESHVPYILQFMIDYNLYGMSFIHLPEEIVKFRRKSEEEDVPYPNILTAQMLDPLLCKKMSCSELEVDIASNFILNRFQLVTKSSRSSHTNPGIESIWHDERMRRQNLAQNFNGEEEKINAIPLLEVPPTQERPNIEVAESEIFYRTALVSKLAIMENSITANSNSLADQTMMNFTLTTTAPLSTKNASTDTTTKLTASSKGEKRTFNLNKFLANAVYPEECTQLQQGHLINASFIENHLSHNNLFQSSLIHGLSQPTSSTEAKEESEDPFLDDTVVDEELVLSLTQPQQHVPLDATLRDEDLQLLDVLQQLEQENDEENRIDLDSSLAPLSQQHMQFELTPEILDKEAMAAAIKQPNFDLDSDNEVEGGDNLHDFSIVMDDIDELLLKISQSQADIKESQSKEKVPQVDGSDDFLSGTPKKGLKLQQQNNQMSPPRTPKGNIPITKTTTPTRSPRTLKVNLANKYAPLPLIFSNQKSAQKPCDSQRVVTSTKTLLDDKPISSTALSLRKKVALTELRFKSISVESEDFRVSSAKTSKAPVRRVRRSTIDFDKTHITCALGPRRKSERLLKVYTPGKKPSIEKTMANHENERAAKKQVEKSINKANNQDSSRNSIGVCEGKKRVSQRKAAKISAKSSSLSSTFKCKDFKIRLHKMDLSKIRLEKESTQGPKEPVIPNDMIASNDLSKIKETLQVSKDLPIIPNNVIASADSEDEIITSDTENDASSIKLGKTPNLKRLHRSFRESMLAKRKQVSIEPRKTTAEINSSEVINSSKFEKRSNKLKTPKSAGKSKGVNSDESCRKTKSEILNGQEFTGNDNLEEVGDDIKTPEFSPIFSETNIEDDSTLIQSFYEQSFMINSPSVFSEEAPSPMYNSNKSTPRITSKSCVRSVNNTPTSLPPLALQESSGSRNYMTDNKIIVTPLDLPPTYEEALEGCKKFDLHEYEFQQPFYSNPDDITKMKEVGFTVLQIPGNKLNDCPEFESLLRCDGALSLQNWRRKQLIAIGGPIMTNRYRNAGSVREYFASGSKVIIEPLEIPPSQQDAKIWLKARKLLKQKGQGDLSDVAEKRADEDSPIKIRRQKVTMMLNENTDGGRGDGNDDSDCDMNQSLSLTPMTPGTPMYQSLNKSNANFTPLSTLAKDSSTNCDPKPKRRARLSLTKKLNAARSLLTTIKCIATDQLFEPHKKTVEENEEEEKVSQDSLTSSTETSQTTGGSSISSQVALAELERSSFVRQLQQSAGEQHNLSFGLSHATLNNTFGFKVNLENLQQAKADIEYNYLTIMTLEVFVPTRGDLYPDPVHDELRCLFYAIEHSIPMISNSQGKQLPTKACGYIIVNDQHMDIVPEGRVHGIDSDIEVKVVQNEIEAFESLLELVVHWDPDIYAGYEIEMSSWGFVIERAKYMCFNIMPLLSRVPSQKVRDFVDEDREQFTDLDLEMKICGRILLDVWRLMRSEIALTSYTFENVMYHILHKRCPLHNYGSLTTWFASPCSRWIVLEYYLERVRGTLALLDQLDLIGRTSEMAKLIGIQFYEVLSRGSQFRVESMMLRIGKPKNLVPLSPSVQQRAHMRAPEYLALIMEPQSRFYADPLIVLDFQSLYPSMIIAYNYCFSTCLGRVEHLGQSTPFEFGASQLRVSPTMLKKLLERDLVTISPCGVVFVKSSVREGILPRMLTEILDTRQMVKQSMKLHKNNTALQRILHSRQLGLKLMANVTYGYTAANFSGRMPSVEVGDTVVSKGRETLERAIKLVETNEKWNVRVVYGDTDSMFVLVPGRNREQAFKIGEEIAETITKLNPHPVKLKLEKVYQPCILQTKKRYVGYMYETPDQTEPVYEAKGIETVRRDGCPAVAKMLEKVLRILFETADVSQVKQYVCRQFTKLLSGRANLQDLIFAKEFRGLNGYKPTACVPALELTRKWIQTDPRHIPRRGERVPFIIVNGPPGVPLIRLVHSPHELLADEGFKINAIYYITKAIIPPINRCLLLIGADANEWFANLPRKILLTPALSIATELKTHTNKGAQHFYKKSTISQYFSNTNCVIDCGRQTKHGICSECSKDLLRCHVTLQNKINKYERGYTFTQQICQACCGRVGDLKCESLDCPVLYVLEVKRRDLQQMEHFRKLLETRF